MNMIWKQSTSTSWVFYDEEDGKIHGKILTTLTHKTFNSFRNNMPLGEYMSLEQAMKSVENPPEQNELQDLLKKFSSTNGMRP